MEINKLHNFKQITGSSVQKKSGTDERVTDKVELGNREDGGSVKPNKKWLFMNYIAADCNLKEALTDIIDNQELVGSDKNTHIVALIDVGPEPNHMDKTWSGARTYYVNHDETPQKINSEVIAEFGNHVNMSDPKTLTDFIIDSMKKFPADHAALVLSDHGGGFTGAMADDTDGNLMTVPQIRQALEEAEKVTGKKIDILGFNACLMADTQAAYEFKDSAKILLASEESEYSPGWTFQPMLGKSIDSSIERLQGALAGKINVSPEEFAKIVVECNKEHQTDVPTFSATDLSKMDELARSVDNLAKAILNTDEKESVKKSMMNVGGYGQGWTPYGDMRDLHYLSELIEKGTNDPKLKEAAHDVQKVFSEAIIANEAEPTKYANSRGLHIYAPGNAKTGVGYGYNDLQFAKDTKWADALVTIGKIPGGPAHEEPPYTEEYLEPPVEPAVWPDGSPRKSKDS
ncbi:MAG: clostripain-related cysteine peptidase [Candidatus Eremiobacterota bacterium]